MFRGNMGYAVNQGLCLWKFGGRVKKKLCSQSIYLFNQKSQRAIIHS